MNGRHAIGFRRFHVVEDAGLIVLVLMDRLPADVGATPIEGRKSRL
jgi:hypothetical protein